MRNRVLVAVLSVGVALLASACAATSGADPAGTISVVGAENQYANVLAQVGGKYVAATAIMSNPNTDPHTFEASASVARTLSQAQLVVQNGVGYDTWANTIESAAPNPARKVITVQNLLGLPDDTPNPHLWYKPGTMTAVANEIAADLAAIQPAHASYFKANAAAFIASLSAWNNAIAAFKAAYPDTAVATTEPVADYMLQAAGADNMTPWALQADIMNGTDPSAQDVAAQRNLFSRAQSEGVSLQSAGDRHADRVVHHAGRAEQHPGGRRLRDDAAARLQLPVLDGGRSPGPAERRGQPHLHGASVMTEDLLRLDGVSVRLGGREILRDVSFGIRPGQFTGLIGPNGAGKTTLIRVILGLQPVTSGSVLIDGRPRSAREESIGYVPQKLAIEPDMPLRVRDVVALGLDGNKLGIRLPSRARRELVDDMLTAVGAQRYANARVGELSGGEQQRVMIAHALISKPKLLLLDEPLANLDISSEQGIVSVLARLARAEGVAVLLSAHDMNPLMPVMDRIVYVAAGRVAVGDADEVVQPEVLSRLYGQHVDVIRVHGRILVVAAPDGADMLPAVLLTTVLSRTWASWGESAALHLRAGLLRQRAGARGPGRRGRHRHHLGRGRRLHRDPRAVLRRPLAG